MVITDDEAMEAMHRARWLAQQILDGPDAGRSDRVLFTTFTRNLATDIRSNLAKICTPQQLQRLEVTHLDAWLVADAAVGLDQRFYEEEWPEVVLPQGCTTLDEYLAAKRLGRGTRLNRQKRVRIWPVLDALRSELRQRGCGSRRRPSGPLPIAWPPQARPPATGP